MRSLVFLSLLFITSTAQSQTARGVLGNPSPQAQGQRTAMPVPTLPPSTEIIVPLTLDSRTFTSVNLTSCRSSGRMNRQVYNWVERALFLSSVRVNNPYSIDKKRARKNPTYLKTVIDDQALYLYINKSMMGVGSADHTIIVILRDAQGNTIHQASHVNTPLETCLQFMAAF